MDEQQLIEDRHFVAELTNEEYIKLRVDVARTGAKLKDWVTQAIKEKLEKIKEEQ